MLSLMLRSLLLITLLFFSVGARSANLEGLWNGTAHFVQDKVYTNEMAGGHKEGFAISRTDYLINGASTVFLYYRCFEYGPPQNPRICLGIYDYTGKNLLQNKGPIISPSAGYFSVAPSVAKVNGTWTMVWEEGNSNGIYWATSADGISWTNRGQLFHDSVYRATPSLYQFQGVVYVFYAQKLSDSSLGILFHSGPSMTQLVQYGGGIVMGGSQAWDKASVSMPRIVFQGQYHWMVYEGGSVNFGCSAANQNLFGWGIARSRDLIHWEKFPGNPIFRKDSTTNPDSCGHDMPQFFVNAIDNTVSVFHTSNDTSVLVKELLVDGNACNANQVFPNNREINGRCTLSCGAMGGNACYMTKTCPSGTRLGMSYDCGSCCKQ